MPSSTSKPGPEKGLQVWWFFFGSARLGQVLLRMAFDFTMATLALLLAVVLRLVVVGGLSLQDTIGTLIDRVNSLYVINFGWFTISAIFLFALTSLYKPLPSASVRKRLWDAAGACLAGLLLHGTVAYSLLGRGETTLEVAIPAWGLLWFLVASSRISRMLVAWKYRLVPRREAVQNKVEDVLVVGGAGYVGSVLTEQLLQAGYRVRILDLELFGVDSLSEMLAHPRLEVLKGDFRNVQDVIRALRGMDAVVHLGAIVGDPACAIDQETTIAVNYAAAKMMAQLARANGIARFVFASTCSVYGASDTLCKETSELNPVSLYATTKIDAERALLEARNRDFQPTILRFATAYGWSHRPRFDLVANLLSAQAVTDQHIRIFNGDQWRPFVHTRDIAAAIILTLQAPIRQVGGQIYNVGDASQNYTLRQLGEIVAAAAPGTRLEEIERDEDARNYRVDFTKIRRELGFRAQVGLEEGIQEIVDAVRSGKVRHWGDPIYSNRRYLEEWGLSALKFPSDDAEEADAMEATRRFLKKAA